jgi:hypothetical protein
MSNNELFALSRFQKLLVFGFDPKVWLKVDALRTGWSILVSCRAMLQEHPQCFLLLRFKINILRESRTGRGGLGKICSNKDLSEFLMFDCLHRDMDWQHCPRTCVHE